MAGFIASIHGPRAVASPGMRAHLSGRRGMTLVELMIVVSILGILAAIVIPTVSNAQQQAAVTTIATDLNTLTGAVQRYHMDHADYPKQVGLAKVPSTLAGYMPETGAVSTASGFTLGYLRSATPKTAYGGKSFQVASMIRVPKDKSSWRDDIDAVIDDGDILSGAFQYYGAIGPTMVYVID